MEGPYHRHNIKYRDLINTIKRKRKGKERKVEGLNKINSKSIGTNMELGGESKKIILRQK
jgi:hypothetical protein